MRDLRLAHLLRGLVVALLLALLWTGGSEARDLREIAAGELLLTARELVYDFAARTVTARGEVELSTRGYRLRADELRYEERTGKLVARGAVELVSPEGSSIFAEELEVSEDLARGFVRHIAARLDDETRIAANLGVRYRGRYTVFEKAVYSPCPVCEAEAGEPFWQVRAARVVHDAETRTLTYENAVLAIMGVPVFWLPYFSHPDPTVERRTGFLVPSIGTDSELGFTFEAPYYIALAENRDLTLKPMVATRSGPKLEVEFRDLEPFGRTEVTASAAYAREYQRKPGRDRDRTLRGHVEAEGRYVLNETDRLGLRLHLASDNTYLEAYDIDDSDILENRLTFERFSGRDYGLLAAYAFQGLREDDDQGTIPVAAPLAELRMRSAPLLWGSHWTIDAGLRALTRSQGLDSRRVSAELGYELPMLGPIGDMWRLRASLRADLYAIDGDPETLGGGPNRFEARLLPGLYLNWRWPLVGTRGDWQYMVEPNLAVMLASRGGNDADIPDEDSVSSEFDETNLFAPSRFAGLDRVEEGMRVAYGLRFAARQPGGAAVNGLVGQLFQPDPADVFPENSGLEGRVSDVVGQLDLRPSPVLTLGYRFRFAPSDFSFRRSQIGADFGPRRLRFRVNYLRLADEPEAGFEREREQVVGGVRLGLTDELTVGAELRYDLSEDEAISNSFGLLYRNPCFTLTLGLERRFTAKGELEDETTLKIRIAFAGLGDIEATSALLP